MTIGLLVADDCEVMRAGIAASLNGTEIQVVASVGSAQEAFRLLRTCTPDVILLNAALVDNSDTETLGRIKSHRPLLMMAVDNGPMHSARAKALGAAGCLSRRCTHRDLLSAIRKAARGESVWSEKQLRQITGPLAAQWRNMRIDIPLTSRQSEVLRHISLGLTTKQIAEALDIRYDTAKEHVQNTMRKIGVSGRTQAAVWAVRKGLI